MVFAMQALEAEGNTSIKVLRNDGRECQPISWIQLSRLDIGESRVLEDCQHEMADLCSVFRDRPVGR
jgi:hypothetical protein